MSPPDAALPSVAFSTGELSPEDRFEAWRETISPVFDLEQIDKVAPRAWQAGMDVTNLGQLLISRIGLDGTIQRGVRAARKIRRDSLDHYVVEVYTGGGCRGEAGSDGFALSAGQVGVFDLGQPLTVQAMHSESLAITIPRALLDHRLPDAARLHGAVLGDGIGRLFGDYLCSLYRNLPWLSSKEAAHVSNATLSMIVHCLAPSLDKRADARAPADLVLLDRAKRFVGRNLGSPELSVGRICAALRVSRSHLYRAFERHGGVSAYVQSRRLSAARAALLDPADDRTVSAVAYDHGFASAAHFSRAFRRYFGMRPSEARESGRRGLASPANLIEHDCATVADWLRDLGAAGF